MFGYNVVYGNLKEISDAGYGRVAHLPLIFDQRPGLHRTASRFMIDRGLGIWNPVDHFSTAPTNPRPPTKSSLKSYADRLINFLEWCEACHVDPMSLDYTLDIIARYQTEMQSGIWSLKGKGLRPKTINARVDVACEYLAWATDKGMRKPLQVPKRTVKIVTRRATSSVAHLGKEVKSRVGKIREPKYRLYLPTHDEVLAHLQRIYKKYGLARGLMAETILQTAIRREEAACWREDTLPLIKEDWHIVNRDAPYEDQAVLVSIIYGAKGPEYGRDHEDKIGPEGIIRIPLSLADRLADYRQKERPRALNKWVRKGKTLQEQQKRKATSVHLFLDEQTGERISAQSLYDTWRGVERPKGWSPHRARDYWACSILWLRMQQHKRLLQNAIGYQFDEPLLQMLRNNALSVIQLEIQPQLRHCSHETTMKYLQWLADRLGANLFSAYEKSIEEEQDNHDAIP